MIIWQIRTEVVHEIYVSCPRAPFVLHVDWGVRCLPRGSRAYSPSPCPRGHFHTYPSIQRAPGCVNSSNALGGLCALSLTDRLSRIPPGRTRLVVPIFELFAASVPRPIIASARVFVFTSNNAGICMDNEYTTAYCG